MAEFKEKGNEKGEYITIAEFAERAGVSKQAVYQRLNKGLKEYSRVVDDVKMLDSRALAELYGKEPEQGIEQEIDKDSKVNSQENQGNSKVDGQGNQEVMRALLEQLRVKDQQIVDLNARLADEQKRLEDLEMIEDLAESLGMEVSFIRHLEGYLNVTYVELLPEHKEG